MADNRDRCIDSNDINNIRVEDYIKNKHPITIKENKIYFENILKLATQINPNIRIILFFLPRYFVLNDLLSNHNYDFKEEYCNYLLEMKRKYRVEIYNLRKYDEISSNKRLFYDVGHLNYTGAVTVTSYLNKIIFDNNDIRKNAEFSLEYTSIEDKAN